MSSLGDRVKQRRRALGLTQAALAEAANISLVTMQKIEYGERSGNSETHENLAKALGVTVSYLVYGDNPADQGGKEYVTLPDVFTAEDKDLVHRFVTMLHARREELNAAHNAAIEAKYDRQLEEEAAANLAREEREYDTRIINERIQAKLKESNKKSHTEKNSA